MKTIGTTHRWLFIIESTRDDLDDKKSFFLTIKANVSQYYHLTGDDR